ncbi:MAG: UDP-N-acetylmuramate dehydrogenase, partial [Micrococcales bacterium]|nr:UDP-N-acetylmuramate dehydrogenase [Micrococcales bacterium]
MTTTLAQLTTVGVGGPARRYVETGSSDDLIDAVRTADADGEPLLVLGGGSNVLVGDDGFDGLVVRDARCDLGVTDASACAGTTLVVAAGTPWSAVVDHAVANGLSGVEALAGIPGSAGATPVQNVGAYGQEVAQTIAAVRTWDRARNAVRTLMLADLEFGYRTSLLKASLGQPEWGPTPRYVVLDVTFQLRKETLSRAVAYPELAKVLGLQVGE